MVAIRKLSRVTPAMRLPALARLGCQRDRGR